jgi:uncharacterized protein (DUF433 family)
MTIETTILPIVHIAYNTKKHRAVIAGTRLSVAFMTTFLRDPVWTVEKILEYYPFLSPVQIYAAWSYYYDHKDEIDRELKDIAEHEWKIGVDASDYFADYIKQQNEDNG